MKKNCKLKKHVDFDDAREKNIKNCNKMQKIAIFLKIANNSGRDFPEG